MSNKICFEKYHKNHILQDRAPSFQGNHIFIFLNQETIGVHHVLSSDPKELENIGL